MPKVRLNIELSQQLADFLEGLAEAENTTRSEMVRRAISVLQAFQQQREIGRSHLGFVKDPRRLDAEILGILQPPPPPSGGASHASAVDHTPSGGARTPAATPHGPNVAPAEPETIMPISMIKPARSEPGPLSMEAAIGRWSPHVGSRTD
jgi:Arc/MetJ-type ribon-helix-helix transcriptional regulator